MAGIFRTRRWAAAGAALVLGLGTTGAAAPQTKREFAVTAYKYGYRVAGSSKPEIRVTEGELVKITFEAEDIPHSFTIDALKIMRRAEPGKPITIEFAATRKGQYTFYCNLPIDERCARETRGTLHVEAKPNR
jgi:heme/copper-type cytochrome/quinol oxidase subunit 2